MVPPPFDKPCRLARASGNSSRGHFLLHRKERDPCQLHRPLEILSRRRHPARLLIWMPSFLDASAALGFPWRPGNRFLSNVQHTNNLFEPRRSESSGRLWKVGLLRALCSLLVLHSGSGAQARVNSPGVVDAQAFQQANVSALFETLLLLAVVHKRRLGLESAVEYAAISF